MTKNSRSEDPIETNDRDAEYLSTLQTFESPPADFDPFEAGEDELVLYGYPRRPDDEREQDLRRLWERAFSRPHKLIMAELQRDRALTDRRHPVDGPDQFGPSGWGGVGGKTAAYGFAPEQANVVYGEWMVPTMAPDFDKPTTPMTVGFWVGLDGYGNGQVLQAGTAATVTGTKIDYWTWFEWFKDPPIRITNFPIAPGELVTVLVCAVQPTHGSVSMLNRTTGLATTIGIPPPSGVSSVGASAEWEVEAVSDDLPDFGAIAFLHCAAGTKTQRFDFSKPTVTNISGSGGKALTTATVVPAPPGVTPTTVLVEWKAIR